jgi:CcmD family protein
MGFVVAAYAIIWLVVFGYLGWIALRLRGAESDLAAVEEQVRDLDRTQDRADG